MAQVPTYGAPRVDLAVGPVPQQNIPVPPSASPFNVLGEAAEKFGKTLGDTASMLEQHAMVLADLKNKADANNAWSGYADKSTKQLDDYQQHVKGADATESALSAAMQANEATRQQYRSTLASPFAQADFDQESRRVQFSAFGVLRSHTAQQQMDYVKNASVAKQNALQASFAAVPTDANYSSFHDGVYNEAIMQARLQYGNGADPEVIKTDAETRVSSMFKDTLLGLAGTHPAAALALGEAHANDLRGADTAVIGTLRRAAAPGIMAQTADSVVADHVNPAPGTSGGSSQSYLNALHGREGTGPNPRSTAFGTDQFTDHTWLSTMRSDPALAQLTQGKSNAEILAMRADPAVADRAALAYAGQNSRALAAAGISPTPANVGLAHGFGAGDAEKIIRADPSTPMAQVVSAAVIRANPELAKQTAGQVVAGFNSRFGGGAAMSSVEIKSQEDAAIADPRIAQAAQQAAGGDPGLAADLEEMGRNRIRAQLGQAAQAKGFQEDQTYLTLAKTALDPSITDETSLIGKTPNGAVLWSQLTPQHQLALDQDLKRNGNDMTAPRYDNTQQLTGEMAAARNGTNMQFLHEDLTKWDLPTSTRIRMMEEQQKIGTQIKNQAGVESTLSRVLHFQSYNSVMSSFEVKNNSPEEFHFMGGLQTEIESWEAAHPKQKPSDQDLDQMINKVAGRFTQKMGTYIGPWRIGDAAPEFRDYNPDQISAATRALQNAGMVADDRSIGRYLYLQGQRPQ